ncbi:MAG: arginine repressor [Ruminococcus sp.]|nr:arginine repressor [Ruminococcus sp.]
MREPHRLSWRSPRTARDWSVRSQSVRRSPTPSARFLPISRDIKDLRLVKTLGSDGKYRYTEAQASSSEIRSNFDQLFLSSVVSMDLAQNIVVIKTLSGMANAVCAALDSTGNNAIVGTIAGDDTIFVACRTDEHARSLVSTLKQFRLSKDR